ncbi:MAG: bifunctional DNA-formamidopyrimidine glycosylase/DNA-(apurinic or apyrimidinic site) lyase [Parvularculaceae bacterium]
MPELPEVETVRRGLAPTMAGATIAGVRLARPDLRFPFPSRFAERLVGARIDALDRRGKYLLAALSTGETLVMHLGMTGRFTIATSTPDRALEASRPGEFHFATPGAPAHDHVAFDLSRDDAAATVVFNDPRRFGFMDLAPTNALDAATHFAGMGPEPLGPDFTAAWLDARLAGRRTPIKAALLDQRVVAGVGNIYACEALFRAGVSPRRLARSTTGARAERLVASVRGVLLDAVAAGGSSLRDFAGADGALGYFQHRFDVYDRTGAPCRRCGGPIARLVQSGRSTFYCGRCQR